MRAVLLHTCFLSLLLPGLLSSGEIYRSLNEWGQVMFTDTPPSSATEVERVILPPGPSAASLRETEEREAEIRRELERIEIQREKKQGDRAARLHQAEKALAEAEAKLVTSKEFQEGDRQTFVGGKSRIRPEYFQRVKEAEEAVEAAKERLVSTRSER